MTKTAIFAGLSELPEAAYMLLALPVSGKSIVKRLKKLGWTVESQRGSHVKLSNGQRTVIVPVHGNHDLGRGLLAALEKQTGEKLR